MPAVVAAAAAVSEALAATWITVGTTAISYATALKAGIVVYGLVNAERQKKDSQGAYNASLRDRTMTVKSSETPRKIIYGKARVGGALVYACNSGSKKEYLHMVLALAGHKITSVEEVWLADQSLGALDSSGNVQAGSVAYRSDYRPDSVSFIVPSFPYSYTLPYQADVIQSVVHDSGGDSYSPITHTFAGNALTFTGADVGKKVICTYTRNFGESRLQVVKFLGDAERDIPLETASAGQWAINHVGNGVARIRCTFKPHPDTFPNGLQNVSAIVKGKAVYDPRTTLTVYSENPALQVLDYLMAKEGFRATLSEIDIPSFIAAANICDELVTTDTGTQKRYIGGGVISEDADRIENLRGLLSSMVGECVQVAGIWFVKAGAFYTPQMTLDDSDFAGGDVQITANTARRSLFNGVKGRFVDPGQLWALTDFPVYASSTYQTEDGGEQILADIDLPFVQNEDMAQRAAKLVLFKSRQSLVIQAEFKLKALALSPLTTIRVKNAEFGWDTINGGLGKLFVVKERSFNPDRFTVTLTLQEEAEEVYDWDYSEATYPDPSPNTSLKDPRIVDTLTGLSVTSSASTFTALKDGTIVPYVLVSWDSVTDHLVTEGGNIRVVWKRANETLFQSMLLPGASTSYVIDGVSPGEILNIGTQAINGAQVGGSYTFNTHTASTSLVTNSQSPRFGLGTNLLENACLQSGIDGWSSIIASGYTGSITPVVGANGAPRPFGAIKLSATGAVGTNAAQAFPSGLKVPVSPSQKLEAQCKVENFRGNANLYVYFYNSSDTYIGNSIVSGVPSTSADSLTFSQALENFKHLWGFVTVPSGAVSAVPLILIDRTATGLSTDVYIAQPYIGVAHANQSLPSPWTDGPPRGALAIADLATTSLIANAAATIVSESASSATGSITGSAFFTSYTDIHSITISNPDSEAYTVNVRAAIQVNASGIANLPFVGMWLLKSSESASPSNEPYDGFSAPVSSTVKGALSVDRRFTIPASSSETYRIVLILETQTNVTWASPKIRTEVIKR